MTASVLTSLSSWNPIWAAKHFNNNSMGRSPLGQLTNLLACINNKLTHITHTHTTKTKAKAKTTKMETDNREQKCDRKQKQEVHWFMSTQLGARGWKGGEGMFAYLAAIWLPRFMDSHRVCCPFAHTHSHTHTLRHERVDLINQCNLSTVHLKSVVCFRGTRHFYLNANSPRSQHSRPAAANLICPPRGLSAAPNKYS